jgi:hypothetical protein
MPAPATILSSSQFSAFFKNRYPQRKIEDLVAYGKPFYGQIKKSDELVGTTTFVPLQFDSPQGLSPSLQDALRNVSSSVGIAWGISPASYYAGLTIDAKTMLASRNNEGAFFRAREREFESVLEQMGQQLEMMLWRTGSGSIGQLSADPGTGTSFTLTDSSDAINFHIGQSLRFYDDVAGEPDGAAEHNGAPIAGSAPRVVEVNEDTGVIEIDAAFDADTEINDHVVRDSGTGASGVDNRIVGVPGWIPAVDPTSGDSHFGVDRSVAPQRLAGHRQTWLGTIEETAKRLDAKIRRINQKGKQLWVSYENFNRLDLELGARGYRMEDGKKGTFGRVSLMMSTPGGGCEVKAAPYVDNGVAFLLTPDTWKLCHLGPLPHLVQDDGLTAVRIGGGVAGNAEDGIEIRLRYFAQPVCLNPYANGRIEIV